ncbi:MAG TPA: CHAT domain-containing protein [Longimicrobiaceae bacterium]
MTMDPAAVATEVLVAYWRREELDLDTRVACGRLAAAVDASGLLAAGVLADPASGLVRLADVLRRGARSKPVAAELVQQLASGAPSPRRRGDRGKGASRVHQNVHVSGNGNVTTTVGGDMVIGGRDRAEGEGGAGSEGTGRGTAPLPSGTILITAASPIDLDPLRLGEEDREIRETLDLSTGRGRWLVETRAALRLRDLVRALQQLRPHILHFCGHATKEEGLILEDAAGQGRGLPPEAMAELFGAMNHTVQCVVLNACYSESQAQLLSKHVPFVIGSPRAVADDAAIAFSIGFYQGVGEGAGIREAFRIGRVFMLDAGTPEDMLPRLLERS